MGDVADTNDFDEPEATGQNQQNIQGEYDFIVKEEFICGGPPYEQSVYKAPDQPIDAAFQFGQYVAQKIRESSNGNSLTLDIMRVILENEQDNGHQTESH